MNSPIQSAGLADIDDKLHSGERLGLADGVRLFECNPLLWLELFLCDIQHRGIQISGDEFAPGGKDIPELAGHDSRSLSNC